MEIIGYGACSAHKHHQLRALVATSILARFGRPGDQMISEDRDLSIFALDNPRKPQNPHIRAR